MVIVVVEEDKDRWNRKERSKRYLQGRMFYNRHLCLSRRCFRIVINVWVIRKNKKGGMKKLGDWTKGISRSVWIILQETRIGFQLFCDEFWLGGLDFANITRFGASPDFHSTYSMFVGEELYSQLLIGGEFGVLFGR